MDKKVLLNSDIRISASFRSPNDRFLNHPSPHSKHQKFHNSHEWEYYKWKRKKNKVFIKFFAIKVITMIKENAFSHFFLHDSFIFRYLPSSFLFLKKVFFLHLKYSSKHNNLKVFSIRNNLYDTIQLLFLPIRAHSGGKSCSIATGSVHLRFSYQNTIIGDF